MQKFIQSVLSEIEYQPVRLIEALRKCQGHFHFIPLECIERFAEALHLPRTQIIAVIEFYSFLHLKPQGSYEILISDSITDHMSGQKDLVEYLCQRLQVLPGHLREDGKLSVGLTSCTGLCDQGPAALVNGQAITRLTVDKIDQMAVLIEQNLPVSQWPSAWFWVADNIQRQDFLLSQPIAMGQGLQVAWQRGLAETLTGIEASGLRGRGGAGFKTALKWRFCAETVSAQRYVVCNADEGEPGTFKDRVLLNRYAHQVFEGMTLCAAIIGATQGFLYLRGEYAFLLQDLQNVLASRRQQGLLGANILGHGVNFEIEIRLGAGAYICGEESALIESLEGKPGIPRNRPPYPVTSGYLNQPTVVNNVETFMAAAAIAAYGPESFAALGTSQSAGSKILSISGDCARPGLYEYPFGVSIAQILKDCGAEDVLGVQVGGPSGSFITVEESHRLLAYEDLATGGSFIVFNNSRSIFQIVKNFTDFFAHESCGFCTPCRVGTSLLQKQLDKIVLGHGSAGDVVELERIAGLLRQYSHCGLGQTAANPVLTTLERYPELYQQQLKKISYEPGFDLDAALQVARQMAGRNDAAAHLQQVEE